MRPIFACAMVAGLSLATYAGAAEEDEGQASPRVTVGPTEEGDGAPATSQSASEEKHGNPVDGSPTTGRPENRWRYRFSRGRWWYWTPQHQWSYFNGSRWVAYRDAGGFSAEKVDPALLSLEAKEGVLGNRKWGHVGGGGAGSGPGWAMSGTEGSMGGAGVGSFTNRLSPNAGFGGATSGGWGAARGTGAAVMGGAPRGR